MKYFRLLWVLGWVMALPYTVSAEVPITASGCSVSNVGYLNDLAKAYETQTGHKVLVRGGGSIVGLTEMGTGKVDLAASCQSYLSKSKPSSDIKFIPASWDALVFIVNKANPVNNITVQQVKDIYEGRITNWKQLGGSDLKLISYITTHDGFGGIGEALEKYILSGKRPLTQINSSMQASSVTIWEQLVERNAGGFASTGFGSARKRDVKMLAVNGVAPSKSSIISGKYPFKRYLYLVMTKDAKPEVRQFVDFALSRKGQSLISSYGMPSLAEIK
ncbi:MAG: substrate-binding domain-containing protein [Desulfuromonadales bacterium]